MTRAQLLKLIRESRGLMRTASPEQKLRLLTLIRESYRSIQQQQQPVLLQETEQPQNTDYLDEK
jgi:hypothetical protein